MKKDLLIVRLLIEQNEKEDLFYQFLKKWCDYVVASK